MQSPNTSPCSGELMERQCSAKMESKVAKLQTLLIGEVFRTISTYMHSTDNLNFLSCHRDSYNLKSPWITMFSNLQLSTVHGASYPVGSSCEDMRKLILHSLCSLGYNCVRCCMPLTGPNGFFACTNLCTSCSLKTIRESGSRAYVDGSVRFYLSGEKSIITKGRAFLSHPYWVSDDDRYYARFFSEYGGNAHKLAEEIFAEKKFFTDYCTHEMGFARPRDDKAGTIRRMLDFAESKFMSESDTLNCDSHQLNQGEVSVMTSLGNITSCKCEQDSSTKNESSITDRRHHPADWIRNLPHSLRGVYENQKKLGPKQSHSVLACATSPLREVVVQMHRRVGAVIKYLPA